MNDEHVNGRSDDHLPNGKFKMGNRAGLGNVNNKRMQDFRRALLEAGDIDTLQAVFRKVGEQAKAGDMVAARLYLEYLCGKPVQAVELSDANGEPLGVDLAAIHQVILGSSD